MQHIDSFIEKLGHKQILFLAIIGAFLLYGNTLSHSYALDDAIVITKNEFTKQGLKGIPDILSYDTFTGFFGKEKKLVEGGRYRPLSLISFAIEYQFFGEKPFLGHLVNILLYAITVFLVFRLVLLLLKPVMHQLQAKKTALVAALLFLIHPIHTEVVANIKGRDELLSLLFSLLSFVVLIKYASNKKLSHLLLGALYLFLGLMSKENTLAFLFIIPAGLYFFIKTNRKQFIGVWLALTLASIIFLIFRNNVLGGFHQGVATELMNNPFLRANGAQKYATILFTWLIYFKLLIFPHPLTYDYYPYHIQLHNFADGAVLMAILLVLILGILALHGIQKKSIVGFSILGFGISFSPVSNLLFPVGTFMNERFIFMPSVFWCLVLAYLAVHNFKNGEKKLKHIIILSGIYVIIFYPLKTIARNKAWKDDLTLFTTDVKTSYNSAKSNCSAGGKLWEQGKVELNSSKRAELYQQSEKYLRQSLKIYPDYVDAWLLLGNLLFDAKKDISGSMQCYLEVLKHQSANANVWANADIVLQQTSDRDLQLKYYGEMYKYDRNNYTVNYRLGVLYGRYFNDLQKGVHFLKAANSINPAKIEAIKDLGTAYGMLGMNKEAYETSKKALSFDKNDPQIYINLGIAASKLGLKAESDSCFSKAEMLKAKK